ncbi:glycoside hydrolase family 35 protein [Edaphobacter modestus]|uniref:Beta-galactosidase n=1 Tax=Edaphobacter modestus TaxID=388466 RepID=A0A4Q7YW83_9BACT|nr:beta-galactosidase family protein [Edaphobacter modestus]RZU41644.1 beta-galactosidase [Edaphobacter modestus]
MRRNYIVLTSFLGLCLAASSFLKAHTFAVADGQFTLDGKPFRVISGEMHYPRIPRAYWRERFRMAKAMGLNTITTYVFWNVHEPQPGVYDFTGNNDIAEFIREAQQEGLYVILRPGPYVCAEWEWGGYPAWLLKDKGIVVRTTDPKFMQPAARWIKRLGQELAPLQIGNGGPIILTQVENEYGSFGNDHAYMQQIHKLLVDAGFTKSQLYTADGPEQVPDGSLPDLPVGINFGGEKVGDAEKAFATLKKVRPNGPFINSEYWAGWFDHWGGKHAHTNADAQVANFKWMLEQGYSVSIYMFHGGTSFGWMNGANTDGKGSYEPDVTSYDYDSALDESGRPTPKYFAMRDTIAKATGITPTPVPKVAAPMTVPAVALLETASLWDNLPIAIRSDTVESMEQIGQAYGYILYRTHLKADVAGELVLDALHSYAKVYVNKKLAGTIDRRLRQDRITLYATVGAQLDILVENTGRVNFGKTINSERAGITREVTLAGKPLLGWEIYPLTMTHTEKLPFAKKVCEGPCFYRGTFSLTQTADTFLDTTDFTKGQLWLNDHALGRVWNAGPQKTLYTPAPWLQKGENEVIVFDLEGKMGRAVRGLDKPALGTDAGHP